MIERLLAFLARRLTLTKEDEARIRAAATPRSLAKGEYVQRAGELARHQVFVASGCLRSFVLDEAGREHVLYLAAEDWWLADPESARSGAPSAYFFQALERSSVLLVEFEVHDRLLVEVPGYAAAYAAGLQRRTATRDQRILATLSEPIEERYRSFVEQYPSIASRVPQYMIAS